MVELRSSAPRSRLASRRERGQTLAFAAIMMVGLVGFLALSIDLGNIYTQRRKMQNAADAGALAAARLLALQASSTAVDQAVQQYTQSNDSQSYGWAVDGKTVAVTTSKTFPTFFAAVVGVPEMTAGAVAKAGYSCPPTFKGNVVPLGLAKKVVDDCLALNLQQVRIYNDDNNTVWDPATGIIASGHRAWLNMNGEEIDTAEMRTWCQSGYQGEIYFPMWINSGPGVKKPNLDDLGQYRLGQVIYVPVYDGLREFPELDGVTELGDGRYDYHVVSMAAFKVVAVEGTTNNKYIIGKFVKVVTAQPTDWDDDAIDTGVYTVSLRP